MQIGQIFKRVLGKAPDSFAVAMPATRAEPALGVPGCSGQAGFEIDLPASIRPHAVLVNGGEEVVVDDRYQWHPALLSWLLVRQSGTGRRPAVTTVSARELAGHRDQAVANTNESHEDASLGTLRAARQLLTEAAKVRASDVHVLIREKFAEVQLRVKDDLSSIRTMNRSEGEALIRAACVGLASVKDAMYRPYEFQSAQIEGGSLPGSGLSSVRIIRGPAYPIERGGGFMVARLQYGGTHGLDENGKTDLVFTTPKRPEGALALDARGYTPLQIEKLETLASMPDGIVLISGPTGSGKNTTLFDLMAHQARIFPGARQITIEDPVEYPMDWAVQLPVTDANDAKFAESLRTILRMNPNIILVGELRGVETARTALAAALTGHMVWSTIHTNDPYLVIDRLEEMDRVELSRRVICDPNRIRGFVGQRLVPVLCPECSQPITADKNLSHGRLGDALKTWGDCAAVRIKGPGCDRCRGDGVIGRRAVAEVVVATEDLMADFVNVGTGAARVRHRARPGSDKSMLANCIDVVLLGLVDPRDAERKFGAIAAKGEGE
ncbi:putative type IV secretion apparatus, ATPase component [Burkholderiales bacterium GJ-E10]|nr:putative type IV secretion apparatus, ATPase component [Burkholderiales bacterium GJ-E10]